MKIAIVSDIHLDMNSQYVGENLLPSMVACLENKDIDLLLIAGDISDHVSTTLSILDSLEHQLGIKILFIPGNHDIWVRHNESSLDSYGLFAEHPSSLINRPFLLPNDYVIIGEMGWFDFTLAAKHISLENIQKELIDWGDNKYTQWGCPHQVIMNEMLHNIDHQLKIFAHKKIIFVTHFVPYKNFVAESNKYVNWDLFNAFMGSSKLGNILDQYDHLEYVVFGHTHERFGMVDYNEKKIICNPLGYIGERKVDLFKEELEQSLTIINI